LENRLNPDSAAKAPQHAAPRPLPIRLLNAAGRLAGDGRPLVSLDPERMIRGAERQSGLSDWGPLPFRPALEALMESLENDAQLNTFGRMMMRDYVLRMLVNRLTIQRDLKAHPEILEVKITRPLFILGLPRTGSTLLQRLLAANPDARSPESWEMMYPSPPPEAATYDTDPRRKLARRRLGMLNWSAPEYPSVHETLADVPEECVYLLQTAFATYSYELMARIPGFRRWLQQHDQLETYRYHKIMLQVLQWRCEKSHWVLKSPFHALSLGELLQVYPDASVVLTHREPAQVVPSLCSLFNVFHTLTSDRSDPKQLGSDLLDLLAPANDRVIELRRTQGEERFLDIGYRELVADPFSTAQRIYTNFGRPLPAAALDAMRAWHAGNPQHKHGVHRYTLDEFGLEPAQVDARFATYRERYAAFI